MPEGTRQGAFVPTTNVWDVSQLYSVDVNSPAFKELLVRLYQNVNNISLILNIKDSGYYPLEEFVTGQQFFPNPNLNSSLNTPQPYRPVFRKVINFGPLPATGTATQPHNIELNDQVTFTRIYGTANNTAGSSYIPLPYSSATLADNIELQVDATNVIITTGADYSAYTLTYVIVEWITT